MSWLYNYLFLFLNISNTFIEDTSLGHLMKSLKQSEKLDWNPVILYLVKLFTCINLLFITVTISIQNVLHLHENSAKKFCSLSV